MSEQKKSLADTLMNLTLPIGLQVVNKFNYNHLNQQLNKTGGGEIIDDNSSRISSNTSPISNFVENDKHQELPSGLLGDK